MWKTLSVRGLNDTDRYFLACWIGALCRYPTNSDQILALFEASNKGHQFDFSEADVDVEDGQWSIRNIRLLTGVNPHGDCTLFGVGGHWYGGDDGNPENVEILVDLDHDLCVDFDEDLIGVTGLPFIMFDRCEQIEVNIEEGYENSYNGKYNYNSPLCKHDRSVADEIAGLVCSGWAESNHRAVWAFLGLLVDPSLTGLVLCALVAILGLSKTNSHVPPLNRDGHPHSDEQLVILDHFAEGMDNWVNGDAENGPRIAVQSVAGSGKTTLVEAMLRVVMSVNGACRTIASAFNKDIAKELLSVLNSLKG